MRKIENKDKKIFIGIIIILLIFMMIIGTFAINDKKHEINKIINSDAIIFKNEYESLNNVLKDSDGKSIKSLSISSNNPVDILSEEETINLLTKGTGLIYFGIPDDTLCREVVPILLNALDSAGIDRLYYLNISNIRDEMTIVDKTKVEVTLQGSKSYYKMLELLDEYLDSYTIENSDGNKIDTKEKRINVPTLVGVKNGEIVGAISDTSKIQEDLSLETQEELTNEYLVLVNKVYDNACDEAC